MAKSPKDEWNYHPNLPLKDKSLFGNIKSPTFIAKWLFKTGLVFQSLSFLQSFLYFFGFFVIPHLNQ